MDDESRAGLTPPHSLEAERECLAAVMVDEECIDKLRAALTAGDFYFERHARIWEAFIALRDDKVAIDAVTVVDRLKSAGVFEKIGGLRSVGELTDRAGYSANVMHYAKIVQAKAVTRRLLDTVRAIEVKALSDLHVSEVGDFFSESERQIGAAFREGQRLKPSESWVEVTVANVERAFDPPKRIEPVKTGIRPLDDYLPAGGLEPGWLVIGMAPPGVGKTTFALGNVARESLIVDDGVVYFSAEMRAPRLNLRLLAAESGVSTRAVKRGDMTRAQMDAWGDAAVRVGEWPLQVEPVKGVDDMVATLRATKERGMGKHNRSPLRLAVVDYVQRVRNGFRNKFEDIEYTMNTLQTLAAELEIPILALSQPSTEARRAKKALSAADAKGSGAIEEDCDLLLILERGIEDRDAAGINLDKGREVSPKHWPAEDMKVGQREVSACGWRWDERYMRMVVP